MKPNGWRSFTVKIMKILGKVANGIEVAIAVVLIVVIVIRLTELIGAVFGLRFTVIKMEFEQILSLLFILVIGVELAKMLFKYSHALVIDVLFFLIARHLVMYHERTMDILLGVLAIAGLFAVKKYLLVGDGKKSDAGCGEGIVGNILKIRKGKSLQKKKRFKK